MDEEKKLRNTLNKLEADIQKTEAKLNEPSAFLDDNKKPKKEKIKNKKKDKKKKRKGPLTKREKRTIVFATLTWIFIFFAILGLIAACLFAKWLCTDMPTLDVNDLKAQDSSVIYDSEGNKVIELGLYLRENIDYEDMPNVLIDAFVAVEDSRFFEHAGFDIPRFVKAIFANISSGDFSQGGSTITMQLIKNTYYSIDDDENSKIASRSGMSGVSRKMQEIVMALDLTLTNKLSKKDTITYYINKVNYGNNIRGVEKAAQYYFGKSASEVNLSEAAFLAGVINSPNYNNPYNNQYIDDFEDVNYLQNGTERRDEVLDLMLYHGYISEQECEIAKAIKLEDLLAGESDVLSETNDYAQDYINRVIDEIIDVTGDNPYTTSMQIYTNMDSYMQQVVYDMQNEEEYTGIEYPSDIMENAIVVLNNQNGAIVALGGGRGETTGARQLNRATDSYLNPGSSIKPVVDYSLAIELLGWATDHVMTDKPVYLYSGSSLIANFDRKYFGDVTLTETVSRSLNTTAVQALSAVIDATSEEYVVDYLNSIGFDFAYEDFDLQFAIGGNRCLVTPLQLAGAHAIFMNKGKYVEPHTVNYIVYADGRDNYVADTEGFQALSEETAWLTAYLEYDVINGRYSSTGSVIAQDYPVYGKTGTTDWGDGSEEYGVPAGSTKDCWLVGQTNNYTITTWLGYDELQYGSYFTNAQYYANTKSDIVKFLLETLADHFTIEDGYDPYQELEMPEGITTITHTLGAYPYTYPSGAYESSTGYIAKSSLEKNPLISEAELLSQLTTKNVNSFVSYITGSLPGDGTAYLSFTVATQTGEQVGSNVDISTTNLYGETTHAIARSYFPHCNYNIVDNSTGVNYEVFYEDEDGNEIVVGSGSTGDVAASVPLTAISSNMKACAWTGTDKKGRACTDLN